MSEISVLKEYPELTVAIKEMFGDIVDKVYLCVFYYPGYSQTSMHEKADREYKQGVTIQDGNIELEANSISIIFKNGKRITISGSEWLNIDNFLNSRNIYIID